MSYETIVDHVNVILDQYNMPLTLRQIYYRLVADYGFPNKRTSYNRLSSVLVKARENNEVDDTRIEDRSREVVGGDDGWDSPEDYLESKINYFGYNGYTRAMWVDQPQYVEVWVEKDALSRVLSNAVSGFRIVTAPSKGYSSYTYLKRMAVEDRFQKYSDKPIKILDFRDHDPSGIAMTDDLENRLTRYGPNLDITVKRIALSFAQVRQYGLAPNPVKMADSRTPAYIAQYGMECWELDAIPPDELTKIVRAAVYAEIDQDIWKATVERSEREKKELEPRIEEMVEQLRSMNGE